MEGRLNRIKCIFVCTDHESRKDVELTFRPADLVAYPNHEYHLIIIFLLSPQISSKIEWVFEILHRSPRVFQVTQKYILEERCKLDCFHASTILWRTFWLMLVCAHLDLLSTKQWVLSALLLEFGRLEWGEKELKWHLYEQV